MQEGGKPTPDKLSGIAALARETLSRITDGYEQWAAFLGTVSRNYKYPFADQLMIHAQRPDASACAEYDVWTRRMGRYVRRGAKGIALVDYSGDAPRLRYVFDVSDTGARRNSRPFRPWEINDANLTEVQLGLKQDFGAEGEWLSTQLQDAARELAEMYFDEHRYDLGAIVDGSLMAGYDEDELRASFIRAASASAAYALLARCGYDPAAYYEAEDFGFLNEWNTPEAAAALGGAVSEINQTVLREIERTIRSYERSQHHDRNNLHDRERGAASEPEPARDSSPREIREDASTLPQRAPASAVEQPPADGQAVRAPERDRGDGAEPHRPDAAETRGGSGRDGGAESRRPHALDGPHERLQGTGRRSSSERVNLQLSFFDEAEDADAPSAFVCPQEVVDAVLRTGENTNYLRERVVAEFEKQRPLDEIAAFLLTVYHGGAGVIVDGEKYAAWMDADGIRIAKGDSARYARDAQTILWETAAQRISNLLDVGRYTGSFELERAASTERELLSQQLVYLYRDLADGQENSLFPSLNSIQNGLFPDVTERVAAMLADRGQCETLLDEYREFLAAYKADRDILRSHYHKTSEILASLESQLLPSVQFHAGAELLPSVPQFITQDEIDELFTSSRRKWRIFRYFTEEHSAADKAAFLKNEYGAGGQSHALSGAAGSHENHDARGMELSKGGCEDVRLTWRQVTQRIDELIAADRFMTAAELSEYDTHTAAYARHSRAKPNHDGDIVLAEHGGAFYAYGKDAEAAAQALGQQVNRAGGWDHISIPSEQLDYALDALRAYKPVTMCYENGSELTVDLHLTEEKREVAADAAPSADEPAVIPSRDPMASAYGVGDFVWLDGREYQITDLQRGYVELLPPELAYPVYRTESRADFERLLRRDERNRYITDYIEQDATPGDAKAAVYIPVAGEWQGFPSIAAAQEAALEEFRRETRRGARNFRITDDHLGEGGAKARFRANIEAIKLLKYLESNGFQATPEQQEVLSRYAGWGGIPDAFDESKSDWAKEYAELKAALTPEEYEAARGSYKMCGCSESNRFKSNRTTLDQYRYRYQVLITVLELIHLQLPPPSLTYICLADMFLYPAPTE